MNGALIIEVSPLPAHYFNSVDLVNWQLNYPLSLGRKLITNIYHPKQEVIV